MSCNDFEFKLRLDCGVETFLKITLICKHEDNNQRNRKICNHNKKKFIELLQIEHPCAFAKTLFTSPGLRLSGESEQNSD